MPGPFTPEEALQHLRLVTDSLPARLTDLEASAAFMGMLNKTAGWCVSPLHQLIAKALDEDVDSAEREIARSAYQNNLHEQASNGGPRGISSGERVLWKLAVGAVFGYGREPGVVTLDMIWELDTYSRAFVFDILERMK